MEIEVYDRKEGFEPRPARDYSVPTVADAGQDIRRLGRTLLDTVEPAMRKRAKDSAVSAAGEADIVRDEEGNWVRPDRDGGGLIYAQAYDEAMDQRYLGVVAKDFENDVNRLVVEHGDDPEAFMSAATARGEEMLKRINPRVRADFDIQSAREISERFRGLANTKMTRDRAALVGGLQSQIEEGTLRVAEQLRLGGDDAAARADAELALVQPKYEALVKLGVMTAEGAAAELNSLRLRQGASFDEADSQAGARDILLGIKGMSPERLRWLADIGATDVDLPGEQFGLPKDAAKNYRLHVPSQQIRAVIGQIAGRELAAREAQEREAYQREQDALRLQAQRDQVASASQIIQAIRDGQQAPALGLSKSQVAAANVSYQQNGTVQQQMLKPEGRRATLSFMAQTGIPPEGLAEYVTAAVQSGQLHSVAEFVHAARTTTAGPSRYAVGQVFFNELPKPIQVALNLEAAGRRHGWPRPIVEDGVRRVLAGEVKPLSEVSGQVENYGPSRNADIAAALKVPINIANANSRLQNEYDELFPYMLQIHQGDVAKARSATAREVAVGWVPHKNFIGGIAPSMFARSGITEYQLNQLPQIQNRNINVQRVRFGQAGRGGSSVYGTASGSTGVQRVQLKPLSESPTKGYGKYTMIFFSEDGRPLNAVRVDLDQEWKNGIPMQPRPAVNPDRSKWAPNMYDSRGKFVGYRLRSDVREHPEKYWQGPRDKQGKPIIKKGK